MLVRRMGMHLTATPRPAVTNQPWAENAVRRYRMSAPKDRWLDRDAGPVVRPYAVTKGRTVPASGSFAG